MEVKEIMKTFPITLASAFMIAMLSGSALAASYVIYTWQISFTVQKPKVVFYRWSDGANSTTCTITENVYAGCLTSDDNATWGIYNGDTSAKAVRIQIYDITNQAQLQNVTVTVRNLTHTLQSVTWKSGESLPRPESPEFTLAAGKKYAIQIEITGASGATPGQTGTITLKLKASA
jgi:hypothetical protein